MKKKRTRQHIIADLGFNLAERQVLKAGFVVHKVVFDYGYDGIILTFDAEGFVENGEIYIQLKSTEVPLDNQFNPQIVIEQRNLKNASSR